MPVVHPKAFCAQQAIADLRAALRALDGATSSVHTAKARAARELSHEAYVNSLDDTERALVVKLAKESNPDIQDYFEALAYRGTSLINELRAAGGIK